MQDVEIAEHRIQTDGSVQVLLRETKGAEREAWVSESVVHQALLDQYFKRKGVERQQNKKKRAVGPSYVESPPDVTVLPHLSAAEDLSAVACVTHKEHEPLQLAKSAGVLCVCLSSGLIVLLHEIFGCESLSQRYFALSEAKCLLPEAVLCVHDDACHLLKYAERRKEDGDVQNAFHAHTCFLLKMRFLFLEHIMRWCFVQALSPGKESHAAAGIAPPKMAFVCDPFHMTGHTDRWRKETCAPTLECHKQRLEGIRSSVCEFTFTWLSQFKHASKHMSQYGFVWFLTEVCWTHNERIAQGTGTIDSLQEMET